MVFRPKGLNMASATGPQAPSINSAKILVRKIIVAALDAFEQGMGAWGIQMSPNGKGISLQDSTLIEDDGPGIGSNCEWLENGRGPSIEISHEIQVKKILYIPRRQANAARLYVPAGVRIHVNGTLLQFAGDTVYPEIPVGLLREGDNEIVLSKLNSGAKNPVIKVAPRNDILQSAPDRKDRPPRSFTSSDGGRTWAAIDGEVPIRLHLTQFTEQGHFISPVYGMAGQVLADAHSSLQKLTIVPKCETPPDSTIEFFARTGSAPIFEPDFWSEWESLPLTAAKDSRYVQWKAVLSTHDPRHTPVLNEVTMEMIVSQSQFELWTKHVRVLAEHNESIRFTSMPFEYENSNHPKLVELRAKYKLDAVVEKGRTEFEKLVLLRDWVSRQWKWTPPVVYPPFDADVIIQRQTGFCVHFAAVFIQCAASLGYQARFVFGHHPGTMGGHEVAEVWSNELRQWIVMDPSSSDNRHYIDPKTRRPLSMLEVHDRMLRTYYGGQPVTFENRPRVPKACEEIAVCYGKSLSPSENPNPPIPDGGLPWPPWTMWLKLHYIPRNNFYDNPETLPRFQGWNDWDWTGYWIWRDDRTPVEWRYRNYTGRRADLDWSINQICFDATYGNEPGTLQLQMGTVTPHFEAFIVSLNGGKWEKKPRVFSWKLQPGQNRIEMRTRNTAGVLGSISFLEVQYDPQGAF